MPIFSFALITLGLCAGYGVLLFVVPVLLGNPIPPVRSVRTNSLWIIPASAIVVGVLVALIPDPFWQNRALHTLGGGVLASIACFAAFKDSAVRASSFQFFVLTVLIVTALGVANELLEFVVQNYAGFVMADSINDTWLDLLSNTVGTVGASSVLVFLRNT